MEKKTKKIGTHSGTFHLDEILATLMLTRYVDEWKGAEIVRTREKEILDKLDLLVDVGFVYDPEKLRFDHHQKEFGGMFSPDKPAKLSSAGLIYKHFGREVIKKVAELLMEQYQYFISLQTEDLEEIYNRVYDNFILGVDAIDNGVSQYPSNVEPLYKNYGFLNTRIRRLNPADYEKGVGEDERFRKGMEIVDEELREQIRDVLL